MSKIRRNFSKDFKTKVVLEALKERSTLEVLAKKYELQPTQISKWKAQALSNFVNVFLGKDSESNAEKKKKQIYRCFMLNCEAHHEYQKNKQEMNKLENRKWRLIS